MKKYEYLVAIGLLALVANSMVMSDPWRFSSIRSSRSMSPADMENVVRSRANHYHLDYDMMEEKDQNLLRAAVGSPATIVNAYGDDPETAGRFYPKLVLSAASDIAKFVHGERSNVYQTLRWMLLGAD